MSRTLLSIDHLPAWAGLNDAELALVRVQDIQGKGCGLVARQDIHDDQIGAAGPRALLRVPRDCVLSAEMVEECAKINLNFRQLLEATAFRSTKSKIILFLLIQIVLSKRGLSTCRGAPLTPWTEYIKFLPDRVPLPTTWSVEERQWLVGTSLEAALKAKLSVLVDDFYQLRKTSSDLQFWYSLLWESETATLQDWVLADALYRSRCLELPQSGEAMVPLLDMANHSRTPTASYDQDANGDVVLFMSRDCQAVAGQEILISYGPEKSAAEMLFTYGFVDQHAPCAVTLPLDPISDDPLGKAKLRILQRPPTLRLWQEGGEFRWESPSAFLFCLNEEDGLDFRVLQHTSGERELRIFWQEEDVTDRTQAFETLTGNHPLHHVFRLRVVVTLLERVAMQSHRLNTSLINHDVDSEGLSHPVDLDDQGVQTNEECIQAAKLLRHMEARVLQETATVLENEKAILLTDPRVLQYLESRGDARPDEVLEAGDNDDGPAPGEDDDDFS